MHTQKVIHFKVDGEREETRDPTLAPNFIISEFGKRDPATNYLIKLKDHGHDRTSYEGNGEHPIRIHEGDRFQIISTGPTPVSDVGVTGLSAFTAGMKALGYEPDVADVANRRITFSYGVESGKFAGQGYQLGLEIPQDFPFTPPSGPHIKAKLHQIGLGGSHPTANVHESAFGPDWQYWSRPFPDWAQSKKSVAIYMAHIYRLWNSQ